VTLAAASVRVWSYPDAETTIVCNSSVDPPVADHAVADMPRWRDTLKPTNVATLVRVKIGQVEWMILDIFFNLNDNDY
jgi:hypothetical protein